MRLPNQARQLRIGSDYRNHLLVQSQSNVGAIHGISAVRAAQLMRRAACTWAKSEGIDLYDKSVPFKNDHRLVKNLYAGLRFFAQQQFDALTSQVNRDKCHEKTTG